MSENVVKVLTPSGYEGVREWDEGSFKWLARARAVGTKYWTCCGAVGHCHYSQEQLDTFAVDRIARYIDMKMVS